MYIRWTGGQSPSSQVEIHTSSKTSYRDGISCSLSEVQKIAKATAAHIRCASQADWDIIASQVERVEQIFLRQHELLHLNQTISVRISASLVPVFIVTGLTLSDSDNADNETVALLSTNTLLIVEPFCVPSSSAFVDSVVSPAQPYGSTELLLRVWPLHYGVHLEDKPLRSAAKFAVGGTDFDVILNDAINTFEALLGSENNDGTRILKKNSGVSMSGCEGDEISCVINKSHIARVKNSRSLLSRVSVKYSVLCSPTAGVDNEDVARRVYFGVLTSTLPSALSSLPMPLLIDVRRSSYQQFIRIEVSDSMRSDSIYVPKHIRKYMKLLDFSAVRIRLLTKLDMVKYAKLPKRMTLLPVRWTSNGMTSAQSSSGAQHPNNGGALDKPHLERQEKMNELDGDSADQSWNWVSELLHTKLTSSVQNLTDFGAYSASLLSPKSSGAVQEDKRSSTSGKNGSAGKSSNGSVPVSEKTSPQSHLLPRLISLLDKQSHIPVSTGSILKLRHERTLESYVVVLDDDKLRTDSVNTGDECRSELSKFCLLNTDLFTGANPLHVECEKDKFTPLLDIDLQPAGTDVKGINDIVGQRPLLKSLLSTVESVLSSNKTPAPVSGVLLTGPSGAGKTEILKSLGRLIRCDQNLAAHFEYFDANRMKLKTSQAVIECLTALFQQCLCFAPTVLCIDNIEAIAPSFDVERAVGSGYHGDTSGIVSLHITRWITYCSAHRLFSNTALSIPSDPASTDQKATELLRSTVCTIMSAPSRLDVNRALFIASAISQEIKITNLLLSHRYELFMKTLLCHARCQIKNPLTPSAELNKLFQSCSQGYTAGDIVLLGKRCAHNVARSIVVDSTTAHIDDSDILKTLTECTAFFGKSLTSATQVHEFLRTSSVTWNQVGGYESVIKQLRDIFLIPRLFYPLYKHSPIKLSKSVLLYGPTGCGKTHLAYAIACECGLDMYVVRGPELMDKYIGASEKTIRNLFEQASSSGRPSLIFFDEFDSLAPKRGKDNTGVTDRVVNQLLTLIDGVESGGAPASKIGSASGSSSDCDDDDNEEQLHDIHIIAATCRPDLIDPALLRPGRIDRHIMVDFPTTEDRRNILNTLLIGNTRNLENDGTVKHIANHSNAAHFTCADLKGVVSTALLAAVEASISADVTEGIPAITASLLMESFKNTRPSLTFEDRKEFEKLYQQFSNNHTQPNQLRRDVAIGTKSSFM